MFRSEPHTGESITSVPEKIIAIIRDRGGLSAEFMRVCQVWRTNHMLRHGKRMNKKRIGNFIVKSLEGLLNQDDSLQ